MEATLLATNPTMPRKRVGTFDALSNKIVNTGKLATGAGAIIAFCWFAFKKTDAQLGLEPRVVNLEKQMERVNVFIQDFTSFKDSTKERGDRQENALSEINKSLVILTTRLEPLVKANGDNITELAKIRGMIINTQTEADALEQRLKKVETTKP